MRMMRMSARTSSKKKVKKMVEDGSNEIKKRVLLLFGGEIKKSDI